MTSTTTHRNIVHRPRPTTTMTTSRRWEQLTPKLSPLRSSTWRAPASRDDNTSSRTTQAIPTRQTKWVEPFFSFCSSFDVSWAHQIEKTFFLLLLLILCVVHTKKPLERRKSFHSLTSIRSHDNLSLAQGPFGLIIFISATRTPHEINEQTPFQLRFEPALLCTFDGITAFALFSTVSRRKALQ